MKKEITKERISLIIIGLLLIAGLIFLIFFLVNKGNEDKYQESYNKIESSLKENLFYLTFGYDTDYTGIDKLFDKKKLNFKDLEDQNKVSYIVNILSKNEELENVSGEIYVALAEKLEQKNDYILITGETVKNKMKEYFNIDWKHKSIEAKDGFIYDIEYVEDNDVYIISTNDNYAKFSENLQSQKYSIDIYPVQSKSTSKGVKTTIAIAYIEYVPNDNGEVTIKYYRDKERQKLITEINTKDLYLVDENGELVENEATDVLKNDHEKFDQYIVTSLENDNKFSLESIVKK